MAFELSDRARALKDATNVNPQFILEIDGIDLVFGAQPVLRFPKIGDVGLKIGNFRIGIPYEIENSRSYIDPAGTTTQIKQQLFQDKGGFSSVQTVKVRMVDKGEELSGLFQPGSTVDDILGRRAKFYYGLASGTHPEDSVLLLSGLITDIQFGGSFVDLNIAHPEKLKDQDIYTKVTTTLSSAITDSDTSIPVTDASQFLTDSTDGAQLSYIKISDEIMKVTSKGTTSFTVTRGELGTTAVAHDSNDSVESFIRLVGRPLPLALKVMLSGGGEFRQESVSSFVQTSATEQVANSITFKGIDLQADFGLVEGDLVTVTGATNGANNVTSSAIESFGSTSTGTYLVLSDPLVLETTTSAIASFRSQYDVLDDGLAMTPEEVDVAEHEFTESTFFSSFVAQDFYLDDTIDAKELINEQLYFTSALYALPRKGKTSVGFTNPPLFFDEVQTLDETTVSVASQLKIGRSINRNFYNAIVYRYEFDSLDTDKPLRAEITQSADSTNRIPVKNRALTINAKGYRDTVDSQVNINRNTQRLLDRYKFGAEKLQTKVNFRTAYNTEIGDVVIAGSPDLKITDIKSGTKNFQPRLMEVINKTFNLTQGSAILELLDTAFELDGRYGIISPSSFVDTGSSTTEIVLKASFSNSNPLRERDKYDNIIGQNIRVHSQDFTFDETVTLTGFSTSNGRAVVVSPALSSAPLEDYIIDVANYGPTSTETATLKNIFVYNGPQLTVVSGGSTTTFDVSASDAARVFVGSIVRVHSFDYSVDSGETEVIDITGTTITVEDDLGFTPSSGQEVDLVGFVDDEGVPYRYV